MNNRLRIELPGEFCFEAHDTLRVYFESSLVPGEPNKAIIPMRLQIMVKDWDEARRCWVLTCKDDTRYVG